MVRDVNEDYNKTILNKDLPLTDPYSFLQGEIKNFN